MSVHRWNSASRVLAFAVLMISSTAIGAAAAAELGVVRISDPDWAPYFFAGKADAPPGLAKEVLRTCVEEAGYRPQFVHLPIERMHHYVESGDIDIVTFSYREDREATVRFGEEVLFVDSYRPIVARGSGVAIESISDFDALRLGHVHGLRYSQEFHDYVDRRKAAGTLSVPQSTRAALEMLAAGRIDVFLGTLRNLEWIIRTEGRTDVEILDFDVRTGNYFVTVPRASKGIADPETFLVSVDACIAAMKGDGRYEAILARYR